MILERCDAPTTRSPNNIAETLHRFCWCCSIERVLSASHIHTHTHWQTLTIYMDKYIGFEMSHLAIDSFDYINTFFLSCEYIFVSENYLIYLNTYFY